MAEKFQQQESIDVTDLSLFAYLELVEARTWGPNSAAPDLIEILLTRLYHRLSALTGDLVGALSET